MEHRFVKISYTGRIKDGAVYDTTEIETAKKENIFDEKRLYRPVPVIIGAGHVLKGLDDALVSMKPGEEKELDLSPENAYGIRDTNLIRLVPMKAFKDQKMMPVPGMVIELDGRPARIQTVSGGRVRVDFNSELAGKTVSYKIKVEEEAKTEKQKIDLLIERSFYTTEGFETKIAGKNLEVSIPEKTQRDRSLLVRKASFVSEIYRFTDIESVTFTETWRKRGKDEKPEAVAPEEIEENAGF